VRKKYRNSYQPESDLVLTSSDIFYTHVLDGTLILQLMEDIENKRVVKCRIVSPGRTKLRAGQVSSFKVKNLVEKADVQI